MNRLFVCVFALFTLFNPLAAVGGSARAHDGESQQQTNETGIVHLTPEQIKQVGMKVKALTRQARVSSVRAPGVVTFNAYRLDDVSSLVDGVVNRRQVYLGDKVVRGQPLLTLTSTALAQAEAGYLRAEAEHRKSRQDWIRLKGLEKQKIVSLARLQQAVSIHQSNHAMLAAARATLASYGLEGRDIDNLINQTGYGQLTLRAQRAGTVVADNFRRGQHVAAGALLLQIADERTVWVEVKLPAAQLSVIKVGQVAFIMSKNGSRQDSGTVTAIHTQLDALTRTAGIRLEINNPENALHPGMFVDARIDVGTDAKALLLPQAAIQQEEGKPVVFVETAAGRFERREVRLGAASMGMVPVLTGLRAGERVVVKGAFSLTSELAKAGFSDE